MAARFYKPTDVIDIRVVPLMLYGGPGVGKTSLLQTASRPVTLDFNQGIHRSFNRKETWQFDTWEDVVEEQKKGLFRDADTVGIDTAGNLLEKMMKSIMAENAKFAQLGGLSQMGWGVLGRRFATWLANLLSEGKSVVFLCHEEDDKKADGERFVRPSLPGRMAYDIMHQNFDLMGHLYYEGDARILNFSPSEKRIAKNSAGFKPFPVGRLEDDPTMLGDILAEAKKKIGLTGEQSAAMARTVAEWRAWIETAKLDQLNERVATELGKMVPILKRQVWAMIQDFTAEAGVLFDPATKKFIEDPNAEKKAKDAVPEFVETTPPFAGAEGEVPNDPLPGAGDGGASAPSSPSANTAEPAPEYKAPEEVAGPPPEKPKRGRKPAVQEGAS